MNKTRYAEPMGIYACRLVAVLILAGYMCGNRYRCEADGIAVILYTSY
jgi:hypothetical protein